MVILSMQHYFYPAFKTLGEFCQISDFMGHIGYMHCGRTQNGDDNKDVHEDREVAACLVARYKSIDDVSQRNVEVLNKADGIPDLTKVLCLPSTSPRYFVNREVHGVRMQRVVPATEDALNADDYFNVQL